MSINITKIRKILAATLALIMLAAAFSSCASRPQTPGKLALTPVGSVGDYEILYEELYYLVKNKTGELEEKYGRPPFSDPGVKAAFLEEIEDFISEKAVMNYAILTLCADAGLTLDGEGMQERINDKIESVIDEAGGRRNYLEGISDAGMTDHYMRFVTGVDLLYSGLTAKYLEMGILENDDAELEKYIKENFVRTWHVMITIDDPSNREKYLAEMQEVLDTLEASSEDDRIFTMYEMIKAHGKDPVLTTLDGYYFTRGSMDKNYENAAFGLEINGISGIVKATGRDFDGNYVDCLFIIQRLPLEDSYIDKNFQTLADAAYGALVFERVEEVAENLSFIPNDYYKTLDLTDLDEPKSPQWIYDTLIVAAVVIIAGAAVICTLILRRRAEKRAMERRKAQKRK